MCSERNETTDRAYEELRNETRLWLRQLPRNVQPSTLAEQFPRLANDIAALWTDASACGKYIDALLFGTRGGTREGFSYQVAFELSYLKALTAFRIGQIDVLGSTEQINVQNSTH
jgi:hypothetical protein